MRLLAEPSRVVRVAVPLLVVLFALSGIWRFRDGPLGRVSTLAWVAFGIVLVATVVVAVAAVAYRTSRGR